MSHGPVVLISLYNRIDVVGLRLLSACVQRAGYQTRLIFLPEMKVWSSVRDSDFRQLDEDLCAQVAALCADACLVGLSVVTNTYLLACQLTAALRRATAAPVIWGGVHPTVRPAECLQHADLVCIGEGERALVELVRRLHEERDYHDVPNLAFLDAEGRLRANPLYPLEQDLDALPFPDYDYQRHLVYHEGKLVPCTAHLMYHYFHDTTRWISSPMYGVFTMRGCPYQCSYCFNNTMARLYPDWRQVRRRSPENIIAEIQAIRERLPGIGSIDITSETFLACSEEYIETFARLYQAQVGLPFRICTMIWPGDRRKLALLVGAGLRAVSAGIQSASPRIQALFRRPMRNEQIMEAARMVAAWGDRLYPTTYDIISDNPYETAEDRYRTLRFVHGLPRPLRLSVFSLTCYPGTEIYARAKADGLIDDEQRAIYSHNYVAVRPNFYNLALFCHHLNLPRPLLHLITRRWVFNVLSREPWDSLCGRFMRLYLDLRYIRDGRHLRKRRLPA